MSGQLDEEDMHGVIALLVRLVRIQNERDIAAEERRKAIERFKSLDALWEKCRDGFAGFGFDVAEPKALWAAVKEAIGPDTWNEAFQRARLAPLSPPASGDGLTDSPTPATAPSLATEQNSTSSEGSSDTGVATVREVVLEELLKAGEGGRKAAEIREAITRALGRELHEKTTGMTLYRLSVDGLVRREGRTWFIVPPKAETVNPGVAAPGLKEMLS